MIEIRSVRSDEMDAMLAVMCEAFDLPFAPAREIFYRDPYFDSENKRILAEDGELISCLTVVDSRMWIGEAPVRVAGIANVSTRASHRGNGYATQLLKESIASLTERGYGLSALLPYSYDFYRRLGWEIAGRQLRLTIPTACLPDYRNARHVRPALPSDRQGMERLYAESRKNRTGSLLRDSRRWDYLFDQVRCKIVYKQQDLEGYAFIDVDAQEGPTAKLRVLELIASTDAARRGLASHLARREPGVATIGYTGCWLDLAESGLMQPGYGTSADTGARVETLPGLMFRILDPVAALREIAASFSEFKGCFSLVLRDPVSGRSCEKAAMVEGDGTAIEVSRVAEGHKPRTQIEGDARTWAQVLTGYLSLDDALALNRLHAYSEAAARLAAPLFPRRDPFLPPADHF